jgi:hypothetical protein
MDWSNRQHQLSLAIAVLVASSAFCAFRASQISSENAVCTRIFDDQLKEQSEGTYSPGDLRRSSLHYIAYKQLASSTTNADLKHQYTVLAVTNANDALSFGLPKEKQKPIWLSFPTRDDSVDPMFLIMTHENFLRISRENLKDVEHYLAKPIHAAGKTAEDCIELDNSSSFFALLAFLLSALSVGLIGIREIKYAHA